jgi:hypothetical protein
MAEPFSFVDGPCALARIDNKDDFFKTLEDFSNFAAIIIPIGVEYAVITTGACWGDFRYSSLGQVSGWLESHRDTGALVFAQGCDNNDAHWRWFIMEDKGVVFCQNIDLGEVNVVAIVLEDILQSRNRAHVLSSCMLAVVLMEPSLFGQMKPGMPHLVSYT